VPGQMAEELGISCIPYLTEAAYVDGRYEFTRIVSGGSQRVAAVRLPVLLTVAKYEFPLFARFAATRRANRLEIIKWGVADIGATQVGGKGSKTQVIRVFPPGKTSRKCQQVSDAAGLVRVVVDSFKQSGATGASGRNGDRGYVLPGKRGSNFDRCFESVDKDNASFKLLADRIKELGIDDFYDMNDELREKLIASLQETIGRKQLEDMLAGMKVFAPSYQGEVWVVAEIQDGALIPPVFELIGKARDLADSLDTQVGVVLAGDQVARLAQELIAGGADNVYLVEHPLLKEFDPFPYRKALAACIGNYWPQIVLYAATPQGRALAPMISYRLQCGLTADCTSLDIRDRTKRGEVAILLQTRPALGGNVMATICSQESRSQMATARPGVMKRMPPDPGRRGQTIPFAVELASDDLSMEIISTERAHGHVNFEAPVIVSGGRGLQNQANYEAILSGLCGALQKKLGVAVEKGASRAAVEQGYAERIRQVGQTGTAVGPKLYLAMGISGAIQHMIGVANTETIVAINNDPNAPIFKQCDYYFVGDVEKIVPELAKLLEAE
jgi:electron transfer flavoprotein alpha subunit